MADNNGASQDAQIWPMPEFYFSVEISNVGKIFCREVSGIDIESDEIEHYSSNIQGFTKLKMPGLHKRSDVTLKRVMSEDGEILRNWINQMRTHIIQRESVTIALLDESGVPVQCWKLTNALPAKYTVESYKADGNVVLDTLVLSHEGMTPI